MKLVEKELGKHQIAADIGCHLFASLPPFEIGGATMGYGLGPAANAAFDGGGARRPVAAIRPASSARIHGFFIVVSPWKGGCGD